MKPLADGEALGTGHSNVEVAQAVKQFTGVRAEIRPTHSQMIKTKYIFILSLFLERCGGWGGCS